MTGASRGEARGREAAEPAVAGRYELLETLHEGRLKTVRAVRDRRAPVASLVMKRLSVTAEPRSLLRFHDEYRIACDLEHPGICQLLDCGWEPDDGGPFIVEERAAGVPLSSLDSLPHPRLLRDVVVHLARVLVYVHGRGLVHFDVKPDNVVVEVSDHGRGVESLKLIDFDLAGPAGPAGTGRGTLPFVAPEVLSGDETIDGRADLYSLGVTLLSWIGGEELPEVPLAAELDDLLAALPEGALETYGRPMMELLQHLLRPYPDERPSGAREVLQLLADHDPEIEVETPETRLATILRPRFVGRHEELARLRDIMPGDEGPVLGGAAPPFVLVAGERGVGKTRLVERHVVLLQGSRKRVLHLQATRSRVAGGPSAIRFLHEEVSAALGRPLDTGPRDYQDVANPSRFSLFAAISDGLLEIARRGSTLVLVVEDVHLLDRLAREFLAFAVRRFSAEAGAGGGRLPLQVLMTCVPARIEDPDFDLLTTELREEGLLETIALEPFEPNRAAELLEAMTSPDHLVPAAADWLYEKTHGNPLFLRETVANILVRADRVLPVEEAFALDRLKSMPVATKVLGVIQSRVARVPEEDLRILQLVALHPRSPTEELILASCGLDASVAERAVDRLARRGLLARSRFGTLGFVDADTREVVGGMMSAARRRQVHERLARVLDQPEELDYPSWAGAYHRLHAAVRGPEAWDAAWGEAERLRRGGRDAEAMILLGAILEYHEEAPVYLTIMAAVSLAEIRCRRGEADSARALLRGPVVGRLHHGPTIATVLARALVLQGRYGRAREVLAEAERTAESARDPGGAADLALFRAETHLMQGRLDETEAAIAEASRRLRGVGAQPDVAVPVTNDLEAVESPPLPDSCPHSSTQAVFVRLRADLEFRRRRLPGALALALLSLKMEARSGNLPGLGRGLHLVGKIYMLGGLYDRAELHFRRALSLQRDVGDLLAQADTLNNLGLLEKRRGDPHAAVEALREALRLRREIGHREGEVNCWLNIANIHLERRELSAAAENLKTCLRLKRKLADDDNPAVILNSLGVVAQLRERHAAALRYYREAAEADEGFGNPASAAAWRANAANLLALVGREDAAREEIEALRPRLAEMRLDLERGHLLWAAAAVAEGAGELGEALRDLDEAAAVFEALGAGSDRAETVVRRIEMLLRAGDFAAAAGLAQGLDEAAAASLAREVRSRLDAARLALAVRARDLAAEPAEDPPEIEPVAEALRQAQQLKMPGEAFRAAAALAAAHEDLGQPERAFYHHNLALEHLEDVLAAIGEPKMMSCWLEVPEVRAFRARALAFVAAAAPRQDEERRKRPADVGEVLGVLKSGFFDAERALGTTVSGLRRSEEGVRRILEIAQTLSSTMPMERLLERIVDGVIDFARAERGFLVFVDPAGGFEIPVARTIRREAVRNPLGQVSRQVLERISESRKPVLLQNAMDEDEYRARESVLELELRSIMGVPMVRDERLLGMLYVDNRSRIGQFQESDLELLSILATQAGIAIENARLVRDFVREEKMRIMGVLAGGVAHDFNNLLAAILGRTQMLERRLLEKDDKRDLETIEKAARDGAVLVRRLQDFTRMSRRSELEPLRLRAIVDDVVEFTRTKWESEAFRSGRQIGVDNRVDPVIHVRGNPSELREVLTNVLLNMLAALGESGELIFESEAVEDSVRLLIRDDRAALGPEECRAVFDPLHTTHDREDGLGMSVAYGILMRHGGRVSVERGEDGAHLIVIELPRDAAPQEVGAAPEAPAAARIQRTPGGRSVLVVDDEDGVRALLAELLGKEGYAVGEASSGPEALERLEASDYDLVLTDLGMVPMSGWDLAHEVRRRRPETPVVLVTGWAEEIDAEAARLRNVDRVISKPFDIDELLAVVDQVTRSGAAS